jgi:hypothetical protein
MVSREFLVCQGAVLPYLCTASAFSRCTYRPSVIYLIVNKLLSRSLSFSLAGVHTRPSLAGVHTEGQWCCSQRQRIKSQILHRLSSVEMGRSKTTLTTSLSGCSTWTSQVT